MGAEWDNTEPETSLSVDTNIIEWNQYCDRDWSSQLPSQRGPREGL